MKNGKIGVGIIGVHPNHGWAANAHVPALQGLPEYELVAISNNTLANAAAAAEKFKVPHFFQDYRDLLACADVDLVAVTVKVPYHFELVSAALRAGKHVYCEWPLGNGLAEAQALQELAAQQNVKAVVGLQSRANGEMRYARQLLREGYVGEVLSANLLGSGMIGGAQIPEVFAYTLDPRNGAGILNVAFAHAIDTLCFALDSQFHDVAATLATRRSSAQVIETGATIPMLTPDQVAITGTLGSGAVVAAHVRGGISRGTNFRLEINGSRGDLVITSALGYPGLIGTSIQGAQDDATELQTLPLPAAFQSDGAAGMSASVASNYALLAADIANGSALAPSFADAVTLHRLIDAIEQSAAGGRRLAL